MEKSELKIVRWMPGSGATSDSLSHPPDRRATSWLETVLGLLTSIVLHAVFLVVLALILQVVPPLQRTAEIVLAPPGSGEVQLDGVEVGESVFSDGSKSEADPLPTEQDSTHLAPTIVMPPPQPSVEPAIDPVPRVATLQPPVGPQFGSARASSSNAPNIELDLGDALTGRVGDRKTQLLGEAGGSEGSERAVQLALQWLERHQQGDGSWRLDFQSTPSCAGQCGDPGTKSPAKNAATALALLPFLGNGHTHQDGPYAEVVASGLEFLKQSIRTASVGGSFIDEGQMYSHGLATITLCEALAMTQDRSLLPVAQQAVDFIVAAQNESQGGWRYRPGEMGDTTVTGWQLMALKTASMSYVHVPSSTIRKAWAFIDLVELPERYKYSYQDGGRYEKRKRRPSKSELYKTTSAVGLLMRMYLGWDRDNRVLHEGVDWLGRIGPSVGKSPNLYFDYYASQVMRHMGGQPWEKWNPTMRDFLIESQSKSGHEAGSWFFPGDHNRTGGRLYCTSLATLILEVYYRHLPLYSDRALREKFRL